MKTQYPSLIAVLHRFAREAPEETVLSLLDEIVDFTYEGLCSLEPSDLEPSPYPRTVELFCRAVRSVCRSDQGMDPLSLKRLLPCLCAVVDKERDHERLELVWTGPKDSGLHLRRTDQALFEVIASAKHRLLVVSFAVYKVEEIARALREAVANGVDVAVVLEDLKEKNPVSQIVRDLDLNKVTFYHWPKEKRTPNSSGHQGAMHAKCAVADANLAFLSSANLTEFALSINMELGLLVRGGDMPREIEEHFRALVINHTLQVLQVD